jgi:SAM-dependent methyltransferase
VNNHGVPDSRGVECNIYGRELTAAEIAAGVHRDLVGGLWDELGVLQIDFLRQAGLTPSSRLLDMGCGCLRGGVHFIRFLDAGHYYGVDANASLLEAGYEVELHAAGLQHKQPRAQLLQSGTFEAWRFDTQFDYAWALSLFTHLPARQVRDCLRELARCVKPGGLFYASFFEGPADAAVTHQPGGITTYPDRDPFHYTREAILALASDLPWTASHLGEWGHPRDQRLVRFDRTG